MGGADAVEVMAGLPWEVLYLRHIAVYLGGRTTNPLTRASHLFTASFSSYL